MRSVLAALSLAATMAAPVLAMGSMAHPSASPSAMHGHMMKGDHAMKAQHAMKKSDHMMKGHATASPSPKP